MAADLINVSPTVVKEWLSRENLTLDAEGHLTEDAIDFLAEKYVKRLHNYFDNCITSWDHLDNNERILFEEFKSKYGKFFHRHIEKWCDIDTQRVAKDFRQELRNKAYSAYFGGLESIAFSEDNIVTQEVTALIQRGIYTKYEKGVLLYELSHSMYYGPRIKTKIPKVPESRSVVLEILHENHFHIFSRESDSNETLIEAFLFTYLKQPQLAIASVYGYLRHKSLRYYVKIFKNKAYCFS